MDGNKLFQQLVGSSIVASFIGLAISGYLLYRTFRVDRESIETAKQLDRIEQKLEYSRFMP